jgi:hypothetical protein
MQSRAWCEEWQRKTAGGMFARPLWVRLDSGVGVEYKSCGSESDWPPTNVLDVHMNLAAKLVFVVSLTG